MKKKISYLISVIVIISTFTYLILTLINNRKNEHLVSEKELVKITFNTVIEAFKVHSDIIYFNNINKNSVTKLLKDINDSTNEEKAVIRNHLYNEFIDMYNNMNSFKIKQLHFHLKNNNSFLRFHRPNKFGDNLNGIRSTIEYVNKYHKEIHGFEEGRIFNGYRFVYPLSFQGKHIGSVETSVSMESIINEFRREMKNDVDFIIKKEIVDSKVFNDEKINYRVCDTTPSFYHEKSISKGGSALIELLVKDYLKSNDIEKDLSNGNTFNFYSQAGENHYVTTFFPIKNAVSNDTVAYIIVSNKVNSFIEYQNQYFLFLFILIILTIVIAIILYRLEKDKEVLKHQDEVLDEVQKIGHLGYWELDLSKNELICSDEVYHIYGLNKTKYKFTYEDFLNYVHPEDVKRVNTIYNQSIKYKKEYHLEHRIISSSGKVRHVEIDCHHTLDNEGNIIQSLGTIHDITEIKIYQEEIEKTKVQFESLVSHLPDVVYRSENDEELTMLYLNDSITSVTGYSPSELKLNRVLSFKSIIFEEDIENVLFNINKAIEENKKSETIEYRIITKNKNIIWVKDTFEIINENNNIYLEGVISDITAQKEAYNKLHKFIDIQENIVILSNGKELNFANKSFFTFFSFNNLKEFKKEYECICDFFVKEDEFFHLDKIDKKEKWIEEIKSLKNIERIVKIYDKDSIEHIFKVTANKFEDNLYIVSFTDISETIAEQFKLEDKNIHDKLTGAYNREFFDLKYLGLIKKSKLKNKTLAVAILDIDYFKKINDTYGHDVGDDILIELVVEINKFSRDDDVLIRWGGEEFLFIIEVSSESDAYKAYEHIRVVIDNHHFKIIDNLTCSIGGTLYIDNEDIKYTIKRADIALYEAKSKGRNMVIVK
jgi:diguanylate cyclase (GGDEF)-like protein/PAS domain S-box-containing protein